MYRATKYGRRRWIGVGFIAALLVAVALLAMQSWRLEQERKRARRVAHIVPELFAGVGAREALEIRRRILGERHPDAVKAKRHLEETRQ
jgi:peptidoglycan/LPS O-acetylase OafA/YrhL